MDRDQVVTDVKTVDELAALRARKRGKGLESYHKKQNAV